MTSSFLASATLSLFPGHKPAHEQMCSAVLNGFISTPISSIRFLVFVFKQESKAVRSICPCSIKCRMMFLPEAPKMSEMKEDRRKPDPFFRNKAAVQKSGTEQGGNPFGIPHICFLPGTFFIWRAFTTSKVISPENASSSIS